MTNINQNNSAVTTNNPGITNPLQTNNTLIAVVAYAAGAAAQKLPMFDAATWNYIFMSALGLVFVGWTGYTNRKTAVVSTVAAMPEVTKIETDKSKAGVALAQSDATPSNVVVTK